MTESNHLSPGEIEVLELVVAGAASTDIAEVLDISVAAVDNRIHKMKKKWGFTKGEHLIHGLWRRQYWRKRYATFIL